MHEKSTSPTSRNHNHNLLYLAFVALAALLCFTAEFDPHQKPSRKHMHRERR